MLRRRAEAELRNRLTEVPAVVLTGPRQAGKTTLSLELARDWNAHYLDLESPSVQTRVAEPELYLGQLSEQLVILDEVHRLPDLFPVLRVLIDRRRRAGRRSGQYLLLGSASAELLGQSGESLAGRVSYLELAPLSVLEITDHPCGISALWLRGGFPDSYLADDHAQSVRWRLDFIRTYLEREMPRFGAALPIETLRRLWTMIANNQAGLFNSAMFSRSLGIDVRTVNRYVDLLVDLLLVRRLPPWHANVNKRLVKSPRLFIRDSGLVHALLGLGSVEALLAHPIAGASWEGFVIEQLLTARHHGVDGYFYRTAAGAEIDLLLFFHDGERWAVEVKRSLAPKPSRGFHSASDDVKPSRRFVVYPGDEQYPLSDNVIAIPLLAMVRQVAER